MSKLPDIEDSLQKLSNQIPVKITEKEQHLKQLLKSNQFNCESKSVDGMSAKVLGGLCLYSVIMTGSTAILAW